MDMRFHYTIVEVPTTIDPLSSFALFKRNVHYFKLSQHSDYLKKFSLCVRQIAHSSSSSAELSRWFDWLMNHLLESKASKSVSNQLLSFFLHELSEDQLTILFWKKGKDLLLDLIHLEDPSTFKHYFVLLGRLLQNKRLSFQQVEKIIFDMSVIRALEKHKIDKQLALSRIFLDNVTSWMQDNKMTYRLSDYLRLLKCADYFIFARENAFMKARLVNLQREFYSKMFNPSVYLSELTHLDRGGSNPLYRLMSQSDPDLLSLYLLCIIHLRQFVSIKSLLFSTNDAGQSCMFGLAASDNYTVLNSFIPMLTNLFGEETAISLLIELAQKPDCQGKLPYYSEGGKTHPLNQFLSRLQAGRGKEALSPWKEVCCFKATRPLVPQLMDYRAFYDSGHSMVFFYHPLNNALVDEQLQLKSKEENEYLPQCVLEEINSPGTSNPLPRP